MAVYVSLDSHLIVLPLSNKTACFPVYPPCQKSAQKLKISIMLEKYGGNSPLYVIFCFLLRSDLSMKTQLNIQERLKDLRVEKGLTLEQLSQQTKIPASTLGLPKKDYNMPLVIVVGGGVMWGKERYWFDPSGRPYTEAQIRKMKQSLHLYAGGDVRHENPLSASFHEE